MLTVVVAFVLGAVVASVGPAAARALITGADIKNHTVGHKDLKPSVNKQLRRLALPGPRGPKGERGSRGEKGDPGKPAVSMFALVKANGDINYGIGVVALNTRVSAGKYSLTFARNVANECMAVAGPALGPSKDTVSWTYNQQYRSILDINVTDPSGNPVDNDWSIIVTCP